MISTRCSFWVAKYDALRIPACIAKLAVSPGNCVESKQLRTTIQPGWQIGSLAASAQASPDAVGAAACGHQGL